MKENYLVCLLLQKKIRTTYTALSELLRLIEVGASCFPHRCIGHDVT